ncbi:hypothetical protein EDD11_005947 [Mortierella claussenii]|nr:hypothetical protein EDD11_005947 [Mortierella claussenii]
MTSSWPYISMSAEPHSHNHNHYHNNSHNHNHLVDNHNNVGGLDMAVNHYGDHVSQNGRHPQTEPRSMKQVIDGEHFQQSQLEKSFFLQHRQQHQHPLPARGIGHRHQHHQDNLQPTQAQEHAATMLRCQTYPSSQNDHQNYNQAVSDSQPRFDTIDSAPSNTVASHLAATSETSLAIASSPCEQHLTSQQYLTMMHEAASRIRALADDPQHLGVAALPVPAVSSSLVFSTQPSSQMSPMASYPSYHHDAEYQYFSLALRRGQTMNECSSSTSSPQVHSGSSSPCGMLVVETPDQQHYHPYSQNRVQTPDQVHSALPQLTQHSAQPRHDSCGDYFSSPSQPFMESDTFDIANVHGSYHACTAAISPNSSAGMVADIDTTSVFDASVMGQVGPGRYHSQITTPILMGIPQMTCQRPDSSVSITSPLLSSSLSSSLTSTSPSPCPQSPLMLSNPSSYSASSFDPSSGLGYSSDSGRYNNNNKRFHGSSTIAIPTSSFMHDFRYRDSHAEAELLQHSVQMGQDNSIRDNIIVAVDGNSSSSSSSSYTENKKAKARYVCQIPNCHRTFSRPFNLKSHGLTHETRRPHACPKCPKTFARIHDRDRHARGHILEKAHGCVVCQGRFARQDAVTRHLKLANEQNPCAVILRSRGISFREAAAGKVSRDMLGEESVVRKQLERLEEQARKARASKNLDIGMMHLGGQGKGTAEGAVAAGRGRGLISIGHHGLGSMRMRDGGDGGDGGLCISHTDSVIDSPHRSIVAMPSFLDGYGAGEQVFY